MGQRSVPFVSVIVPVYNDAPRLGDLLACLRAQTWPSDRLEVIVVDNGSTDDVAGVLARHPWVIALQEPQAGSYAARNRGIEAARGEILAFTDADCLPAPTWLERGIAPLSEPGVGMVGGRVELRYADPRRPTAVELFDVLYGFPQERFVRIDHFSATANLITRRDVIDRAGPFDASLKSGGDREWGERAVASGFSIVYAEDAVVGHPARRTLRALTSRAVRIAGGLVAQTRRRGGNTRAAEIRELLWGLRPPITAFPRVWRDPRVPDLAARLRLLGVIVYHRYRVAWERLRLLLGEQATR